MRFAFLLKKQTGFYIEDDSLRMLSDEIARQKAANALAEAEQPVEVVDKPEADAKAKKQRKPRTKKGAQAAAGNEVATMAPVAQNELIAFV
jgi:hypothetical protein